MPTKTEAEVDKLPDTSPTAGESQPGPETTRAVSIASSSAPEITVTPLQVPGNGELTIKGTGFPPEEPVWLGFGQVNSEYDVVSQVKADRQGSFSTTLSVPDFASGKDQWVVVAADEDTTLKVVSEEIEILAE